MSSLEERLREEANRHRDFAIVFLALLLVIFLLFLFFNIGFFSLVISLSVYVASSFLPDILFILLGIVSGKPFSFWRKITHKFLTSLFYFISLFFLTCFFFQFPACLLIAFSGVLGYWVHLFADKLEEVELFFKSLFDLLHNLSHKF